MNIITIVVFIIIAAIAFAIGMFAGKALFDMATGKEEWPW